MLPFSILPESGSNPQIDELYGYRHIARIAAGAISFRIIVPTFLKICQVFYLLRPIFETILPAFCYDSPTILVIFVLWLFSLISFQTF